MCRVSQLKRLEFVSSGVKSQSSWGNLVYGFVDDLGGTASIPITDLISFGPCSGKKSWNRNRLDPTKGIEILKIRPKRQESKITKCKEENVGPQDTNLY